MDYTEWIELLPHVLLYLVSGFSFYILFTFSTGYKLVNGVGEAFLLELTVGFIITNFLCMIPIRFGYYVNRVGLVVFSVLLGWGGAKLVLSNCFHRILDVVGIHKTVNGSIWSDIANIARNNGTPILICCYEKDTDKRIFGQIRFIEENSADPRVAIQLFAIYGNEDLMIEDMTQESNALLILQTSNLRGVEIYYPSESEIV